MAAHDFVSFCRVVRMGKRSSVSLFTLIVAAVVSGCGDARGAPDREETFAVQGAECTAKWWLDPLVNDVPAAASVEAARALTGAKVEASELEAWKRTIVESKSGDREITESRLEGFAYVEAVRADVRLRLAEAGFPDAPTRFIEVYSDVDCS
jgi:hypothetical protein